MSFWGRGLLKLNLYTWDRDRDDGIGDLPVAGRFFFLFTSVMPTYMEVYKLSWLMLHGFCVFHGS